jgi:hypothetical protein
MGLIINSTEEVKIFIQGTEIEVPSIYARLEFAGRYDGKKLDIGISTYASKEAYAGGANILSTTAPLGNISVEILENEMQSLETAHEYAKKAYEEQGYEVIIDLPV